MRQKRGAIRSTTSSSPRAQSTTSSIAAMVTFSMAAQITTLIPAVVLDPATDKPAVYPHCCRRFEPRLARSYHRDRDTAQLRLRRWRQFAKISFGYHPGHIARQPGNATFLTLGLVTWMRGLLNSWTLVIPRDGVVPGAEVLAVISR